MEGLTGLMKKSSRPQFLDTWRKVAAWKGWLGEWFGFENLKGERSGDGMARRAVGSDASSSGMVYVDAEERRWG